MNLWHVLAGALILFGSTLALTAAIGIVRFPDTLTRMHAATKPQVIGLILVLAGAAIQLRGHGNVWTLVLVGLFTLLTAPVIAHLIGRTAYREQRHRDGLLRVNELRDDDID
ncbi:monovalent cation/H(+) antiporter subunit G [Nocardia beijingensis]|uniref:monovalent cation/H(+) antiporter subunit G n=1 Tax=Nocardia beijingensis TaxID=95162 RepID=UPI0018934B87|nr:monovalent cation/H(+) antiporter subunit G [Nocardia beijingensis]MBF6077924.1 monovalent cation/H(+) antiporter subunit G [Nocardia beijingensis]